MGGFCKNDKKTWGKPPQNERKCQILRKSAGRAVSFLRTVTGQSVCPKILRSEKKYLETSAPAKEKPPQEKRRFQILTIQCRVILQGIWATELSEEFLLPLGRICRAEKVLKPVKTTGLLVEFSGHHRVSLPREFHLPGLVRCAFMAGDGEIHCATPVVRVYCTVSLELFVHAIEHRFEFALNCIDHRHGISSVSPTRRIRVQETDGMPGGSAGPRRT